MALRDESIEYRLEQYNEKNDVLAAYGERVSGRDLYKAVFDDLEQIVPVVTQIDGETKSVVKWKLGEAIEQCQGRNDMMIGGVTYFNNFICKAAAKRIHAFIIDMDNVYSGPLKRALMHDWKREDGKPVPMPTYIVNSGTGLHLYFVLNRPLPHYKRQWEEIDQLYRRLAKIETTGRVYIEFSSQWFGQDFRMAGGLGKDGWENTVFKVGEPWEVDELAAALGMDFHFEYEGDPFPVKKKKRAKQAIFRRTGYYLNQRVYESSVERCRNETHEGRRYMSMCALAVLAWKCKVDLARLRRDLVSLLEPYNKGATRPIKEKEIESAVKMYNPKALMTCRETTENWLGWKFIGARRNGRKRPLHLKIARAVRDAIHEDWREGNGRPIGSKNKINQKAQLVADWRRDHPDGRKIDCERELKISRPTVLKWWDFIHK